MIRLQSIPETLRSHRDRILVIGAIAGLTVAPIALLYLVHTDTISGGEATAIATVLLVVLTGVYVTVTYLMMRETRKARQQEIKPAINEREASACPRGSVVPRVEQRI
jgi:heme/copper-type cytochrome/quinol oxidase subunit 4